MDGNNFTLQIKGIGEQNQRVYDPEDRINLAVYEGVISNGMSHGFSGLTIPKYIRLGTCRNGRFTGRERESRLNSDLLEGK